jgi:hypothetical protein
LPETKSPTSARSTWSLDARTRSQRLLMALYDLARSGGVSAASPRGETRASGYYLNNAKLRFQEILRGQAQADDAVPEDSARMANLGGLDAEPHEISTSYCHEAERLARRLGCAIP